MFENIVSDLLNKVLGTYIENLDPSKLRIGLWNGDVELLDLNVKQSALDELDLPVRPVFGHIGRLTLKIPWKNLYTASWVAIIEGVLLLAVPNTAIKYDATREEQLLQDAKMAALQKIEEAKQRQKHKEEGGDTQANDGFVEKLLVAVIQNLQVKISNIHIRYEDPVTQPGQPFSLGITLSNLGVESTNSQWKPCLDTGRLIYKLNSLESLAVYWNPGDQLLSSQSLDRPHMIEHILQLIKSSHKEVSGMKYVVGPISSSAKLQMNPKPESDGSHYSIPKFLLDLMIGELAIGLSRMQYSNLMALLDSLERMRLSTLFRKFRPDVQTVKGHPRVWWLYAYNCLLENIHRRHTNWSWKHMRDHRVMCRKYKEVYKAKLQSKKLSAEEKTLLEKGEKKLNLYNLTLVRRQAEMEVEREGKRQKEEQQNRGWFGGWFGGGGAQTAKTGDSDSIVKKFEDAMTPDEKAKLYTAIGYSEMGAPPEYPPEFVGVRLQLHLTKLALTVTDEQMNGATVMKMSLTDVSALLLQRPSVNALKLQTSIGSFSVTGLTRDCQLPSLVNTLIRTDLPRSTALLDIQYETKPPDGKCDQRVILTACGVEVIYDAATVNRLAEVFAPPENISLQQLQAAALNHLEVIKERSATGMQAVIDDHSVVDVHVAFDASRVVIPERGVYHEDCSALILNLGSICLKSIARAESSVKQLLSHGQSKKDVFEQVKDSSYDRFVLELVDIQALVCYPHETWKPLLQHPMATTQQVSSPLHILNPVTLHVDLYKCLLTDDPNLAWVKVNVDLASMHLCIADDRLLQVAGITFSIPTPERRALDPLEQSHEKDMNANIISDDVSLARLDNTELNTTCSVVEETPQFTHLRIKCHVGEVMLELKKVIHGTEVPLLRVAASEIKMKLIQRTFTLGSDMSLGGFKIDYLDGGCLPLLSTEGSTDELISLIYSQANPKSPDFYTRHKGVMQLLELKVSSFDTQLEQVALLTLMAFADKLTTRLNRMKPIEVPVEVVTNNTVQNSVNDTTVPGKGAVEKMQHRATSAQQKKQGHVIALKIVTQLEKISVSVAFRERVVAHAEVCGLWAEVEVTGETTVVSSRLKDFTIYDPSPGCLHPMVWRVEEGEALDVGQTGRGSLAWDARITIFAGATDGSDYFDMEKVDTDVHLVFCRSRIVFLNRFMSDILSWVSKFQTAKEALASASAAAAAAARANLQDVYYKCSRVRLCVTFTAPLIVVPKDSFSLSAVIVDLGEISVKNEFLMGSERNELGAPSIFDRMGVILHNLKLSRVQLNSNGAISSEHLLLHPITMNIDLNRNLTISWCKKKPEIDIQARLNPVKMCVSEEDFHCSLEVLQFNLGEKLSTTEIPDFVLETGADPVSAIQEVEKIMAEQGFIYTRVIFSLSVQQVSLSLFTTSQNLTDVEARNPLADFSLEMVTIKGDMLSNDSLSASAVLYDCILKDSRPGSNDRITKMFHRKETSSEARGIIDVTCKMAANKDTTINCNVSGFVLVVHLPFLLKLQSFFLDNMPVSSEPATFAIKVKDEKIQPAGVDKESESVVPAVMTLRLTIEQPDIALVEDIHSVDTMCIILHLKVNSDIKISPGFHNISAGITNLQIYTSHFNPRQRAETMSQILSRCDISVISSLTASHAEHVNVKVGQVDLRVSPGTIELLSRISLAFSSVEKLAVTDDVDPVRLWPGLWKAKPIDEKLFPFLAVELATEATSGVVSPSASPLEQSLTQTTPGNELAIMELECFVVTLETGSGVSPIPLIKMQMITTVETRGFKSTMFKMDGNLSFEVAYYNPRLAVWEPLLEPVEVKTKDGFSKHVPWMLKFEMTQDTQKHVSPTSTALSLVTTPMGDEELEFDDLIKVQTPVMLISVEATEPLQLTVTRTFMDVQTMLVRSFTEAYKHGLDHLSTPTVPYRVVNTTGVNITVQLEASKFQVSTDKDETEVTIETGNQVELVEIKSSIPKMERISSLVTEIQSNQEKNLILKMPSQGGKHFTIPVLQADRRYFPFDKKMPDRGGLISTITVENGCKIITLSSCVQVCNHLDATVEVYYMMEHGNEVQRVASVAPNQTTTLPLHAVYTKTCEIFFTVKGHSVSTVPFVWRNLLHNPNLDQQLECAKCHDSEPHAPNFYIVATGQVEQVMWENTSRRTIHSSVYTVELRPIVVLHNLLPIPLGVEPPGTNGTVVISPGSTTQLTKAKLGSMYLHLQLPNYQGHNWVCGKTMEAQPPELSIWTFECMSAVDDVPVTLDLGMHVAWMGSTMTLSLYCPFWMVNKTGLKLAYRRWRSKISIGKLASKSGCVGESPSNVVTHDGRSNEVALFSFRSKVFFGKKKATIMAEDSDWSDKFSLDVVGSSGLVICKSADRSYQIGVDITLSQSGLSKIVTFLPFYKVCNRAPYDIQLLEVTTNNENWITMLSGESIGWWPIGNEKKFSVRVCDTQERSQLCVYDQTMSTILKLNNKFGGIFVDVSVGEGGTVIELNQCEDGSPTALFMNHLTDSVVTLWQVGVEQQKIMLEPHSSIYFAWPDVNGIQKLSFTVGANNPVTHSLAKDGQGTIGLGLQVQWAIFLCGNQRCLLFTDCSGVICAATNAVEFERIESEVKLSLNSIGISLVDDIERKEVIYMSLTSSGIVWENRKKGGRKHRPFTQEQTNLIEKSYGNYQDELKGNPKNPGAVVSHFVLGRNLDFDFATMMVQKPFERHIRRTFQPGVWFQLRSSPRQRQIHLKLNSVQIDNQMRGAMFPVVLARVPLAKSVMAETVAKPFCEVSILQHMISPSFTQYKNFHVLVQEFHVKVELPLVYAVLTVMTSAVTEVSLGDHYSVKKYEQDAKLVHETLNDLMKKRASDGRKDYFDRLHLSPIKMHLSFSLTGTESGANVPVAGHVIRLFLQSVGVTLTEVQDVVFKLAYLERENHWLSWSQLVQEMTWHYSGQVLKQMYVLVLGLDVIGNPYGLVIGLTKGVEDFFYEPFQGLVEGPGEFAEGVLYGVRSLFSASVGGAAGAVSRITGTLGKGIAALTLDDDYQRRRREEQHKKPADGLESFARGGKGLVTGVYDGVTGVITKPLDGAREQGVGGFFKGVGKGVVGLVTRPASGVIDFASGSLDAVMRATDSTEEIVAVRAPRFIAADGIIRPYCVNAAHGAKILMDLEKGRYVQTDVYVDQCAVKIGKSIILASDRRIFLVSLRNDILAEWKIDWVHGYEELSEAPSLTPKGLHLSVKQEKQRVLGLFGGGDNSKVVPLNDEVQAKWFLGILIENFKKVLDRN